MSVLKNNSLVEPSVAFAHAKWLESSVETAVGCWLLAVALSELSFHTAFKWLLKATIPSRIHRY